MKKYFQILFFIILLYYSTCQSEHKLEGRPISSEQDSEMILNPFDGDISTEFTSSNENGWIGIELSSPSKITKIGFSHNTEDINLYLLGIFEGANDITFFDSVPLYMITQKEDNNKINYIKISCNKSFKYIRYTGPKYSNSFISEFELYGNESKEEDIFESENIYQPSNIPLLVINTENGKNFETNGKEVKINSNILLINKGKIDSKSKGTVKLRGNSSLNIDKKSYTINLNEKIKILDIPSSAKKWVLISNIYDKTLIRNVLAYKISSLLKLKYTPSCRYIDLIFNGNFMGNYLICDKIEVSEGRLNITKMDETCTKEPELSGGYLIEGDTNGKKDKTYFKTNQGIRFSIKHPKEEKLTKEQYNYISNKFNVIESEIYNNNINNIDVESFAKYFIVEEFCANVDAVYNSIYLFKERNDDKIYFGPVWDMDLAFDNSYILFPTNEKKNFAYKFTIANGSTKKIVSKLLSNEIILKNIKKKWDKMINTVLTKEYINKFINEQYEYIYQSQKLNFIRWKVLEGRIFMEPQIFKNYDEEVDYLKQFIEKRFDTFGQIVSSSTTESVLEEYETQWDNMGTDEDDDGIYGWEEN